jgi:AcrR family transcriptional regulator
MRYKDDNKKDKIIMAAIQLINEVGLAEISMSKIAKEASVSAGTIYIYFDNKYDMIKKLFLTVKRAMQQKMLYGINGSMPTEVEFKKLLKNYIDFTIENKDYFLFFEQYINSPLVENLCGEEAEDITKPLEEFFEIGKEHSIFRQIDIDIIFTFAFSPLMQIAKKYYNGEFEFSKQNVEEIMQMSWDAIKK